MAQQIRISAITALFAMVSLGACATANVDPLKDAKVSFERMGPKIPASYALQYDKMGSVETVSGGGKVELDSGIENALKVLLNAHFAQQGGQEITVKAWPSLYDAKPEGLHWQVEFSLELDFYDSSTGVLLTRLASTQRKDADETGAVVGQSALVGTLIGAPLALQMEADWLADLYNQAVRQALIDLNQQLNDDQALARRTNN